MQISYYGAKRKEVEKGPSLSLKSVGPYNWPIKLSYFGRRKETRIDRGRK